MLRAPTPHSLDAPHRANALPAELLAGLPDPVVAIEPDGVVVYANPAAQTVLGGGADMTGRRLWDDDADPGLLALQALVARALATGGGGSLEVQVGGVGRWCAVQAFRWEGGAALRFVDITSRRGGELRARRERNRTAALLDQMSAGLVVTTLDGTVLDANARFLEMTGLSREEVLGSQRPHPWWTPEHSADYERRLDVRAWRNHVSHVETVFRHRDGREFPARVGVSALTGRDGAPEAVIKTVVDISEEHLARQMLRRSEAEFRLLAEQSADLICRHDPDGRMLYVSPASRSVLDQAPFAARGCRLEDFVHGGDREAMATTFAEVLADGRDRTIVVRGRGRAGERSWLETTVRRVTDGPEGEQLISATRDVTTRHLAQLEAAAMSRVAESVAAGSEVAEVAAVLAGEAAALLDMDTAMIWRFADGEAVAIAATGTASTRIGARVPLAPEGPLEHRIASLSDVIRMSGCATAAGSLVTVGGATWGALMVGMRDRAEASGQLDGLIARMAGLASTTIARAEASAELTMRAERDPLTGVANRAVFDDRLADAAARGQRVALCLIDIDHFKAVNDTHGHDVGDEVLRRVAGRLQESARRGDLVARVGGEEFAWLMPATALEDAVRAAERARMLIAGTMLEPVRGVTVSLGISAAEPGHWDAMDLFRTADRALYAAKRSGRDRVVGLPG